MAKTVVGLFDDVIDAQNAVQGLLDAGFARDEISLLAREAHGDQVQRRAVGEERNTVAEGAGTGAISGGVLGGVVGLLVGVGALAIPGIGPVLAAGPLAAALGAAGASTLVGAGIGAATGGVIGALIGAGVPEDRAGYYAEGVRRGGTLVMVQTSDEMAEHADDLLRRYGAVDIESRGSEWRSQGWKGYDDEVDRHHGDADADDKWHESSKVGTAGGTAAGAATGAAIGSVGGPAGTVIGGVVGAATGAGIGALGDIAGESVDDDFNRYDDDFRTHYQSYGASSGYPYEQYQYGYRYGLSLAADPRYRDRDWDMIEADARRNWEERNPGTWDHVRPSVHYAWNRARTRR